MSRIVRHNEIQGLNAPKHHRISASGTILDVMYFLLLLTQVKKLQRQSAQVFFVVKDVAEYLIL